MASLTEIFTGESRHARDRRIADEAQANQNLVDMQNTIRLVMDARDQQQGEEQAAAVEQERLSSLEGSASTVLTSTEGVTEDPVLRRRKLRGMDSLAASDELLG